MSSKFQCPVNGAQRGHQAQVPKNGQAASCLDLPALITAPMAAKTQAQAIATMFLQFGTLRSSGGDRRSRGLRPPASSPGEPSGHSPTGHVLEARCESGSALQVCFAQDGIQAVWSDGSRAAVSRTSGPDRPAAVKNAMNTPARADVGASVARRSLPTTVRTRQGGEQAAG